LFDNLDRKLIRSNVRGIYGVQINFRLSENYKGGIVSMKKSGYIKLYIAFFAVIFFINILFMREPDFSTIIAVILVSLMMSLIPYLLIILIIHLINHDSRPS